MFTSDYSRVSERHAQSSAAPATTGQTAASSFRTLMLGCGSMGGALLERWRQEPTHDFLIARRRNRGSHPEGIATIEDSLQVADASLDFLVIAVKPQQIRNAAEPWLRKLKPGGAIVSIAAGVSTDSLETMSGVKRIIRLMPNLAVRVGRGVCGLYCTPAVTARQRKGIVRLLERTGETVTVEQESDLDRITAVAGSGTGFILEVAASYAESIRRLGFDSDAAERLAVETLLGAALLASESEASPDQLRDQVTSAGGTTASGLEALRASTRLDLAFDQTFQAALRRAIELR